MKILLLTDNEELLNRFVKLVEHKDIDIDYTYSYNNDELLKKFENATWIKPIKIKENIDYLIHKYNLIFSLHSKQIFSAKLVNSIRCINIHPGLNPYNRGWYPQVFSIINGLPCGATIHEIDNDLDHGNIIIQKEVKIEIWDTSISVYNRILDAEMDLLYNNLDKIIANNYKTIKPKKGNLNLKRDFDNLCEIDLQNKDTFINHINKLRALTHGDYQNSYFVDDDNNKIYLSLKLIKDESTHNSR